MNEKVILEQQIIMTIKTVEDPEIVLVYFSEVLGPISNIIIFSGIELTSAIWKFASA